MHFELNIYALRNILYLFQNNNNNYLPSNFFFLFNLLIDIFMNTIIMQEDVVIQNILWKICLIKLPQISKGINH